MNKKITRREAVSMLAVGLAAAVDGRRLHSRTFKKRSVKENPPNIILIMADDLGYGDLGAYNRDSQIPTPHIDRLAEQGVRFTHAYAPSSVCTPTRYGLLTGRYCWRTSLKIGVILGFDPPLIEKGRLTLASFLKEQGYSTACVGKWHLGLNWGRKGGQSDGKVKPEQVDYSKRVTGGPDAVGFDYSFVYPCALDFPPFCFVENGMTVGIPSESIMKETALLPPRYKEQYEGLMVPGWKNTEAGPTITRKALEWIENHNKTNPQKPFFLYLPTMAPHVPYAPPDFITGRSRAGRRGDMCAEVDWTVSEVMKTLERLGLRENTLVIFTSDNGAIVGDRKEGIQDIGPEEIYDTYGHRANGPFRGQKWTVHEGGFRVPFIASWPGRIKQERVSDELICLTDLMTTFAAILSKKLPDNAGPDSHNVLPALLGELREKPVREAVVLHSQMGLFAIRQGKWKLIEGHGLGTWYDKPRPPKSDEPPGQLYNLETDPGETKNVWTEHPNVVKRLLAHLDRFRTTDRSAPVPQR